MTDDRTATNLVIFIADALRRDFFPDELKEQGLYVDTITDGYHTVSNTPSILAGVGLDEHGAMFYDTDDQVQVPTVLDLDAHPDHDFDTSLWPCHEHPSLRRLFNYPPSEPLADLAEPFVYVERCVATHLVYGQCSADHAHDNATDPRTFPDGEPYAEATSQEYRLRMQANWVDYIEDYRLGVQQATSRFHWVVNQLRDRGVLEDTLVVFTSDHGEAFPEDGYEHILHGPALDVPEVREVGTVFYDRQRADLPPLPEGDLLWSSDIINYWWPGIGDVLADVDVETAQELREGEARAIEDELRALGYLDAPGRH